MTPLEISEYKKRWYKTSSYYVITDELFEYEAKRWCRTNLDPHKWYFIKYTDCYEDTFLFEDEADKNKFVEQFLATKVK